MNVEHRLACGVKSQKRRGPGALGPGRRMLTTHCTGSEPQPGNASDHVRRVLRTWPPWPALRVSRVVKQPPQRQQGPPLPSSATGAIPPPAAWSSPACSQTIGVLGVQLAQYLGRPIPWWVSRRPREGVLRQDRGPQSRTPWPMPSGISPTRADGIIVIVPHAGTVQTLREPEPGGAGRRGGRQPRPLQRCHGGPEARRPDRRAPDQRGSTAGSGTFPAALMERTPTPAPRAGASSWRRRSGPRAGGDWSAGRTYRLGRTCGGPHRHGRPGGQ